MQVDLNDPPAEREASSPERSDGRRRSRRPIVPLMAAAVGVVAGGLISTGIAVAHTPPQHTDHTDWSTWDYDCQFLSYHSDNSGMIYGDRTWSWSDIRNTHCNQIGSAARGQYMGSHNNNGGHNTVYASWKYGSYNTSDTGIGSYNRVKYTLHQGKSALSWARATPRRRVGPIMSIRPPKRSSRRNSTRCRISERRSLIWRSQKRNTCSPRHR